jgi:hypothetical protein
MKTGRTFLASASDGTPATGFDDPVALVSLLRTVFEGI